MDEFTAVLKARELVKNIAPAEPRISLQAYADQVGAVIKVDRDLKPDEQGYCVCVKGKSHIYLNGSDDERRQRFTACHEIAHIALELPSEHSEPLWSYAKRSSNEILCDVFAAELLLPYTLFRPLVEKSDISLAAIDDLADQFMASNMATGSRFAALQRAPCAFVLSEQGKVRYAARSASLRDAKAWVPLRAPLPADSLAARLRNGGTSDGSEEVDADIWFNDWDRGGVLMEDARHLKQWDQTVALLWFEDEELPPQRQDHRAYQEENLGLAELDGVLPWPGRRRRK
jgi:Zn-dependent peptidase ImmA (M78 family)